MRTLLTALALASLSISAHAATQADAEAALSSATQVEATAAPGNRWLPTEAALEAAKKAIAAKDWDEALAQATKAHALAERSVEQSKEQETAWHAAVIR
jgi:membrane-bound lytic murein transglycosylase B